MGIDLSEFRQSARVPKCGVRSAIETLEEGETLKAALGEPDITTSSIHRWLKKRGVSMSVSIVDRHRKQNCACFR